MATAIADLLPDSGIERQEYTAGRKAERDDWDPLTGEPTCSDRSADRPAPNFFCYLYRKEGLLIENQMIGMEADSPRAPARVLIVDDEESIRRLVSKWTDVSDYEVKAASSAEAALLIMHAWTADVVVCDIRMPRYSGVWLIEHLRTLYPATAIVISTGYGELDPALMVRARITGYLAKPYDRATLIASLDHALNSRRPAEPPVH